MNYRRIPQKGSPWPVVPDAGTWRGCPFVKFRDLPSQARQEARRRFSARGRAGLWREIESWAFPVRRDGTLASTRRIHPVGPSR